MNRTNEGCPRGNCTGLVALCLGTFLSPAVAQPLLLAGGDEPGARPPTSQKNRADQPRRGLLLKTDAACAGYTLFAPLNSTTTYLVDLQGRLVHSWPSKYAPGQAAHLLEDGSLLRSGRAPRNRHFGGGGIGGLVERITPGGEVRWQLKYSNEQHCQHHDIKPLPNGNLLLIAWEKKTRDEAIAAGRDPRRMTGEEMWPDCIIEVKPKGKSGGKIVWEWHAWDHLVQDVDETKANYGIVAEHPELVDLNYRRTAPRETPEEVRRLRALGYVGGGASEDEDEDEEEVGWPPFGPGSGPWPGGPDMRADWGHTNAIDYHPELDQIALSVHTFNEVWIIDHRTTAKEAASHRGGRYGRGGDLLYRWGNPRAYGAGKAEDQTLFAQHDVRWIPKGSPGAGHLTIFNNGLGRPGARYSSVVEIAPPIDGEGRYRLEAGKAFGPAKPVWEYTAADKQEFFASHISGAERLPNGNTLICSGEEARIFEVRPDGETVWDYHNPYLERTAPRDGPGPFGIGRILQPGGPGGPGTAPGGGSVSERDVPPGAKRLTPPRGPGGPPGPRGGGPGGGLFRATRYPTDHPGVKAVLNAASKD